MGGSDSAPTWLAGLGVMLGAGAVVAIRRRSLEAQAD
ncbi:LPXTG cell wall anchor domain-containing protein [Arthrobacter sp. S39]|nr:LPXTG cell wall anchor domain-containing protein [Arthrobacter sp. S39]